MHTAYIQSRVFTLKSLEVATCDPQGGVRVSLLRLSVLRKRSPRPSPASPDRNDFTPNSVAVDIWQDYLPNPYSWMNSLLVHLLVITALVLPFELGSLPGSRPTPMRILVTTPLHLILPHGLDEYTGGGGGGNRSPTPASRDALPRFARVQFTPPSPVIPATPPLLVMQPTLIGPPELQLPEMKSNMAWGDPQGVVGPPSYGPGTGGGIGPGAGTGVGPGAGSGFGPGCCEGVYMPGGGVSAPVPIYSPEPAYSEQARQAKFQGKVTLWIVVGPDGTVRSVRVTKPLGMGLDEEAAKTVRSWRFKPGLRQGVPVPVEVQVEVSFRLF